MIMPRVKLIADAVSYDAVYKAVIARPAVVSTVVLAAKAALALYTWSKGEYIVYYDDGKMDFAELYLVDGKTAAKSLYRELNKKIQVIAWKYL